MTAKTRRRKAARRRCIGEALLIWPDADVPQHIKDTIAAIKAAQPNAKVARIMLKPQYVRWVLDSLDKPLAEVPPMIRPVVSLMQRHGARELPALIVDGRLVATGETAVARALARLAR